MFDLNVLLAKSFPHWHFNILLLLGMGLFLGSTAGRIFQLLRFPQVVGYILMGVILGESGFNIINEHLIQILEPLNYFALGLIGFMIGGELRKDVFVKYGRQLVIILLSESLFAFGFIFLISGYVASFFFPNHVAWPMGLMLGAIGAATAPAATTDVLWEMKTKGPLTTIILSIVALDDALALFLFAIGSSIAQSFLGGPVDNFWHTLQAPLKEIAASLLLGFVCGMILFRVIRRYVQKDRVLSFFLGSNMLVLGIALALHLDMIMAAMMLGCVLGNMSSRTSTNIFELVSEFAPPIYVLFFVFVGAKMNVESLSWSLLILSGAYCLARMVGKMLGASLGSLWSRSPLAVQNNLRYCLFSQAGVAIGLSIVAGHLFPAEVGQTIAVVVTTSTFVVQLVGPILVKYAMQRSGEAGLNITAEEIAQSSTVQEVLQHQTQAVPLLAEQMPLQQILQVFSKTRQLHYPVLNNNKQLIGQISIDGLREIVSESPESQLILAHDLMEEVKVTVDPTTSIAEAQRIMDTHNEEYCFVMQGEQMLGLVEHREIGRFVSTQMLQLKKQAVSS